MLSLEEAGMVVAYLNRAGVLLAQTGQAAVWRDALGDVRLADAAEACRALVAEGTRDRFVTPAELRKVIRRLRAARIADRVPPAPPVALEWAEDLAFRRAYLRALGDGASEAEADEAACRAVGVERARFVGPARNVRELRQRAAGTVPAPPEGGD